MHVPHRIRRGAVGLLALGAICLAGIGPGAASVAGDPAAVTAGAAPPLRRAHATLGEAVPDAEAAAGLARHMVEDLVAEGTIAPGWRDARVASAERRRLSRRSPFHVWVVRFTAPGDVDGKGTDLFVVVSDEGEFLQYGYEEP